MIILRFILLLFSSTLFAQKTVNVYVWGGEIPKQVVQQFEKKTGIKVNFSTYDSNETMVAKIKASGRSIYDVILPSAYYVERMQHLGLLSPLDHRYLPNLKYLDKRFTKYQYDVNNQYSVPLIWGATGIFYNQHWVKIAPKSFGDLWNSRWNNQLMFLDDPRDTFAIALLALSYSPNDRKTQHIHQAFVKLLDLMTNIKIFASESIQAIMIDEDAIVGTAWNGDAYKAHQENPAVQFVYPSDGFVIWIDCLAMPINPPHPKEAYAFINFLLEPTIAAEIGLMEGHAITNAFGKALLPKSVQKNPMIYPDAETLKRGYVQQDVGEDAARLYNQYWQQLKLSK